MKMNSNEDMIIDIGDLLAHVLMKWKTLCIGMLVGLLLIGGYRYKKNVDSMKAIGIEDGDWDAYEMTVAGLEENLKSYENQLADAKAALTPFSITYVERLASQYRSYIGYKKKLLEYYLEYMLDTKDLEENIIKRIYYRVEADTPGTQQLFTTQTLLFTQEEFERLKEISPDEDALFDIYGRIRINAVTTDDVQILNTPLEEGAGAVTYMLNVILISSNEEECNGMHEILDEAITRLENDVKDSGIHLQVTKVTESFTDDVIDTIINGQQGYVDNIVKIDNALANLQNNFLLKLSTEERTYFDLIKEKQEAEGLLEDEDALAEMSTEAQDTDVVVTSSEQKTSTRKVSLLRIIGLKYLLLGLLAGLFVAGVYIVLRYLLDGTIKSKTELQDLSNVPVLADLYLKNGKQGLFSGIANRLRRNNIQTSQTNEILLAHDLTNMIRQKSLSNLYFAIPASNERLTLEAKQIQDLISQKNEQAEGWNIQVGAPVYEAEELDAISAADAVVVFVNLRSSLHQDLQKLSSICNRYEKPVLGLVSVEEC